MRNIGNILGLEEDADESEILRHIVENGNREEVMRNTSSVLNELVSLIERRKRV